ncbi:lactosylceramide 4-alpha-galactosyltransferase-like [Pieris brassicae]|uniref:Alpha 1,4-glycosyltransferase domain-containing protein n=1 Tax=Pieris brassicae TaxID=7116 RepID=A0A9P0WYZ5_PIEBR|nr:lactosylceramide 4-alpha-galactosyltransferase-like [Pieris brassicae]CAH3898481.1 unnamed protein product [Pieris brassicae]
MSKIILRAVVVDRQVYVRNKRKCNYFTLSLFALSYIVYVKYALDPNFSLTKWNWNDDISCYLDTNDNLSTITAFNPTGRSIFFNDPTCNVRIFNPKDACSIESAARAHWNWPVYVLFNSPVSKEELKKNDVLKVLMKLPNIKFARVNIEEFSMGTPAEGFVSSGVLNDTVCPIALTGGLVKYLTLYKWGGIFMDKDFIVTKSLSSLPRNWVPKSDDQSIGSGILAISKEGRSIAEAALRLLIKHHKNLDCANGENVMAKIVEQECSTPNPISNAAISCNGFEIYGPQFFYPIESQRVMEYSEPGELQGYETAYTYYLWSKMRIGTGIKKRIGSRYSKLTRKHCPAIYNAFAYKF